MKDLLLISLLILSLSAMAAPADLQVGPLPNGNQAVPTGQILHAPGESVYFKDRPVDLVMSPSGRTFYIKNFKNLQVVDNSSWTLLQATNYPAGYASLHGIAINHAGTHLYVTGTDNELFDYALDSRGLAAFARTIRLGTNCDPCGIALSPDGTNAYVCLGRSNTLAVVDLVTGSLTCQINVGVAPWGVALSRDGLTAYVSDWGGRHPAVGDLQGNSVGSPIVVDNRGIASSGTVSIVDLTRNLEVAEIPTGLHPSDLKLSRDNQTLYVANANSDTVTVINTATRAVAETILMRPDPRLPFGSASDGLCAEPRRRHALCRQRRQ